MDGLREKIVEFLKTYEGEKPRGEADEMDEMYSDQVALFFYNVTSKLNLDVEFTACENSSNTWIESSVFVPKLVGNKGYYVTVDCDVPYSFDDEEQFIDCLISQEEEAQKILSHFKK